MDLTELFQRALTAQASDLFITEGKKPYLRLFGRVTPLPDAVPTAPGAVGAFRDRIIGEEKADNYRRTGACDCAFKLGDARFRLNFFNAHGADALVARPLRRGDELFFEPLHLPAVLAELAEAPRGIILVCGAAGSGKSTTLGAMVNHINRKFARHIITIEDPVEYLHDDFAGLVAQREISSDVVSFAEALRSVVRESPDVIVIGEMRDLDTMKIAISAALTGHLVISTLHTADTIQSLERIINTFPEDQRRSVAADLSAALVGIVAQRLLPAADGTRMVPAVELLSVTPMIRKQIAELCFPAVEDALRRANDSHFQTFNRALLALVESGTVTADAALAAAANREEFLLLLKGMESGTDTFRVKLGDEELTQSVNMKLLLQAALRHHASDLIISVSAPPMLRINGELVALELDVLSASDTQRLLFSILSARQRAEFETNREIDFALAIHSGFDADGTTPVCTRFRINGFYQRGSVGVAIRVISNRIPAPAELGLPDALTALIAKRQGLVLITGPTGHGKSTTQACLIDLINQSRSCHIITVEDPIEYVHTNKLAVVEQRELHADTLSFAAALKFVLRQDPDVILVGEMRDPETIAAALTAAETGHLVLATLHTNSAPQTIDRIIDSFPAHQQNQIRIQLASTILAVVAQRLVPRKDGAGRVAAFEIMNGTTAVQALIRDGKTSQLQSVMETSYKDGMLTMDKALGELYAAGSIGRDDYQSFMKTFRNSKEF